MLVFLSRRGFWVALSGFAFFVLASTAYVLFYLREEVIDSRLESAETHARAFEDQITQSLHVIDLSLTRSQGEFADSEDVLRLAPYVRSFSILDPPGRIWLSSNPDNAGVQIDRAEFFPQSGEDILRIGTLHAGRDWNDKTDGPYDGRQFIPLLREAGNSARIATLNPDYFLNQFLHRIDPATTTVHVLRYDGILLITSDETIMPSLPEVWEQRLTQREFGAFRRDTIEGEDYIVAYRSSRTYPLVTVVYLHRGKILAEWQSEAFTIALVVLLALAGFSGLSVLYYRRMERATEQRRRDESALKLSATVFEASQEAFLITNDRVEIISVNRSFTDITGYSAHEVMGKNPSILASGYHSREFFEAMWSDLLTNDHWQGEVINRRKDGTTFPEWLSITTVREEGRITHYIANFADISVRKAAEEKIRYLAFYDTLTDLPNRRLLHDRLNNAVSTAEKQQNCGAILFIDLDHFKNLNDTRGHDVGDSLLQQVAQRLTVSVRPGDTVARLGGDEFIVLLEFLGADPAHAAARAEGMAEKIRHTIAAPYLLEEREYHCTPSVGIALFMPEATSVDTLLRRADVAMYQAKAAGRNAVRFFDPQMQSAIERRVSLEADLRNAIAMDEFVLHFQPQVNRSRVTIGVEALVRWRHPQRGLILPSEFIEMAEETGLILPLGEWVIRTAAHRLQRWATEEDKAHLTIAVNVSPRQFRQSDFVERVSSLIKETGIEPSRLRLELTESLLLEGLEQAIFTMTSLKAIGVSFSLDDFGTGYSSLSYLKLLPLDELKVDQSFVRDVLSNARDAAIARTIVSLGQNLGVTVTAEGVETHEQWEFLAGEGCDTFQGYLFGHPVEMP